MVSANDEGTSTFAALRLMLDLPDGTRREERIDAGQLISNDGLVLGRASPAGLILQRGSISRQHCCLNATEAGAVTIRDLGSQNGTVIDGRRLAEGDSVPVTDQSLVEIGDIKIRFLFEDAEEAAQALATGSDAAGDENWTLHIRSGGARDERHVLSQRDLERAGGIVLGRRKADCDIMLADPSVSRAHCRIGLDSDGRLTITDLDSRNGTLLDGNRLAPNIVTSFAPGSRIELGAARLIIAPPGTAATMGAEADPAAPPGDATVIGGAPLSDATVIGGAPLSDATVIGGAPLSDATVIGGAPLSDATVLGQAPPAAPAPPAPAPVQVSAPSTAPVQMSAPSVPAPPPGQARSATALAVFGSFLIPAAIIVSPLVVLIGPPEISTMAARYLVILVVALVAIYAVTGIVGEIRRRRNTRGIQALEIEKLRREIALVDARQEREEENVAGNWSGFRKFKVMRKVPEGGDICSFYLAPHDDKPHPGFEPGQHITFQLRVPDQPKPVIRCYTLSDSPFEKDYYRVSIKRALPPRDKPDAPPGLSSNFFHNSVQEGDILDVRAPSGKFYVDMTKNTPIVLIGGGIGLTPALSIANAVAASGSRRETWIYYGVRHGDEEIMKDHLAALGRDHENIHVQICYSNPRDGVDRPGVDYQHAERVSVELMKRQLPSNNYDFYICGPPPMMESLVHDLDEWGVPESAIHFEAFGPATVKRAGKAAAVSGDAAKVAASVQFSKSGKVVPWAGDTGSLLEFAEANGIVMDSGCRAGSCGTCLCAVKSGKVRYMESPGIEPDPGSCLPCIAVPDGDVVLEA